MISFSLLASKALVASSKNRNSGFLYTARAIRRRCFCPWLTPIPSMPILVLYPKGSESIKSRMFATFTACSSFSIFGSSSPTAMLLAMESENIKPSCITAPLFARHKWGLIFSMGMSPNRIVPLLGV